MISIKNLTKYYGQFKSIDNVSLIVPKGTIYGFIGPNGAGKSTLIKCIMNILNYSGEIKLDGILMSKEQVNIKNKIGYLPSEIEIYEDMKVKDFIEYNASFYDFDCMKKASELIRELELDTNKKIKELSLGNLKKVGIVVALMHEPELIILDEATSGLDPLIQDKFHKIIRKEKELGHTIFLSSHNLKEVSGLCDDIALIKNGRIVKIKDITKLYNHKIITIEGNISKIKSKLKGEILDEGKNKVVFSFDGDINKLIKELGSVSLDNLLIENPELEDVFLFYYKEDEKHD